VGVQRKKEGRRKILVEPSLLSGMNIFCMHTVTITRREREEEYAFVTLLLILTMMMFRTVLRFFFSLYRYITERKKKTGTVLKDDKTCLLVARSGLNSAMVMFLSFSLFYRKKLLPIFLLLFLFVSLILVIMFTMACIMLLCAYFQGSLPRFCLEKRNEKEKTPESCITHRHG